MTDILQKYGITFDEERHAYARNGFALPSVTQILPFKCDGPEDVIRKAAERGHRVHKWIELTELNPDAPITELFREITPGDERYCEAWLKFKEITGFELARVIFPPKPTWTDEDCIAEGIQPTPLVERFTYHEDFHYVGRLDLIGYLRRIPKIENDLTLVDAKTGIVSPTTALQTAAYQQAHNREFKRWEMPKIKHRWAAKLMPDGNCKREHYTDDRGDFATFLNRLGWVRWAWAHGYEVPDTDYFIVAESTNEPELSIAL